MTNNTIQELREYIDELHIKLEYDDYVNLINLVDEIDTQLSPQEDLREWIVDNFEAIKDDVFKSITNFYKERAFDGRNADLSKIGNRIDLNIEICNNLKKGLLNVIDTYEA